MLWNILPDSPVPARCFIAQGTVPLLNRATSRHAGLWLLLSLMMLGSGPGYAEWVVVESEYQTTGLQTVYVDPETISREGNLVKLLQLTDYRWMQGGPRATPRFLSTTSLKQYDCAERRLRLLAFTEFPRRMATGRPAAEYVDKEKWLPVRPDSIDQALWVMACSRR